MSSDTRLIEKWLPIAALGEESVRERRSMTALPPIYYLHVWWARRPLIASRAAIMSALLPANADRARFVHALGIHGNPVASRRRIESARRRGIRFEGEAYDYPRAFTYRMNEEDAAWFKSAIPRGACVLDPTAGGGSIPFESLRLGISTFANELNPVATLVLRATIDFPLRFGGALVEEFHRLASAFVRAREERLRVFYPAEPDENCITTNYLWARTISCPYCDGLVPLSPNWRLNASGMGVRIVPHRAGGPNTASRRCSFEVVTRTKDHSAGTVSGGDGACPYSDCGRVIDGELIKQQAQQGSMRDQLYAIVFKRKQILGYTKGGKKRVKWIKGYRAPVGTDENSDLTGSYLSQRLPEWEALDMVPTEDIPDGLKTAEPIRYGMKTWRELFSDRELISHCVSVEIYRELVEQETARGLTDITRAAFVYLSLLLDKFLNYNSRMSIWMPTREVVANTFNRHDFAFCWSYAEMPMLTVGVGYDWAVEQTAKCIGELVELARGEKVGRAKLPELPLSNSAAFRAPELATSTKSADSLDHLSDGAVDVIVMDPPYYDNVMYAELSDFFYVWLKRTAGHLMPELFRTALTDKEHEAVANPSKFKGQKGAKALAGRDYQQRMAAIFAECRRVLKSSGLMTLMFTHKATGAWDALTKGLMEAGFIITASWPINTEAESSMHIKDKAAANSTIFLVCRPRTEKKATDDVQYWEDVEPQVAAAVRDRIKEFQEAGIGGVDLYLACFGPALQKFSEHWPLRRGTPRPQPEAKKRRKQAEMFEEEWDPYAVTPEDALDAARRVVKQWRLDQLTHKKARTDVDALTAFYVLAWDSFKAPKFDFDEALQLARVCGVDMDKDVVGHVAEKAGSSIVLWDSAKRAAKGALGPGDGSRTWLDAVHHAAYAARTRNLQHAHEQLQKAQVDTEPQFFAALEAVLEVLPVSKAFSGIDLEGDVAEFGSDFEALENLRKLAFTEDVDEPEQLKLWKEEAEVAGAQ